MCVVVVLSCAVFVVKFRQFVPLFPYCGLLRAVNVLKLNPLKGEEPAIQF